MSPPLTARPTVTTVTSPLPTVTPPEVDDDDVVVVHLPNDEQVVSSSTTTTNRKPRKGTPVKICAVPNSGNPGNESVKPSAATSGRSDSDTETSSSCGDGDGELTDEKEIIYKSVCSIDVSETIATTQTLLLNGKRYDIVNVGGSRWITKNEYEMMRELRVLQMSTGGGTGGVGPAAASGTDMVGDTASAINTKETGNAKKRALEDDVINVTKTVDVDVSGTQEGTKRMRLEDSGDQGNQGNQGDARSIKTGVDVNLNFEKTPQVMVEVASEQKGGDGNTTYPAVREVLNTTNAPTGIAAK